VEILYKPGARFFSSKLPFTSEVVDNVREVMPIETKGIGSLFIELNTLPFIIPF
jgi:hypothetical protein